MAGPHKSTRFEDKWGEPARDIALREGVDNISTIHMRVNKFGHPLQRKRKPSKTEILFGETVVELAHRHGSHPNTVSMYIQKLGLPYCPSPQSAGSWNRGLNHTGIPWQEDERYLRVKPWLMEDHPDFYLYRNNSVQGRLDYLKERGIEVEQPTFHTMAYKPGEIE